MAKSNIIELSSCVNKRRFDPEFFQREYIELDKIVGDSPAIIKIAKTVDLQSNGAFKVIFNILNDNNPKIIPYIRSGNVGDFFLNKEELAFISKEAHKKLPKTHTKHGDVLMARKGKIGGATIIFENEIGFNSNDNIVNIRLVDERLIPEYFVTFWNSKFGLKQIERLATGNVQPWLSMTQIRMLKTVIIDKEEQEAVRDTVVEAYNTFNTSQILYIEAQQRLKAELGLYELKFQKSNGFQVSFSEVMEGRRFDAQCYNPEYVNYELFLRKNCKFDYLKNILNGTHKGKQMPASSNGSVRYSSIKDIQGIEVVSGSYCTVSRETRIADRYDLLLAITGATIGKIGIVERYKQLAFCGDLLALKPKVTINPYYLLAVLQSPIGQSQCKRWITGTTNGHLAPYDVEKLVIPRIDDDKEQKIAEKVEASLHAKRESEKLIIQAKQHVEQLIEEAVKK